MSQTVTKTKTAAAFTLLALVATLSAGCKEEAPELQTVELPETPDLFEQPIQPDPLAPTAEDIVVTVDGKDITHGEIMQAVQMRMMQLSRQVAPQQLQQLYPQVYQEMNEMMVANILLGNAAKKSSLTISEEDFTAEIEKIKAANQSEKTLEETLAENNVDLAEWKDNLRNQMLVGKLVEEKTADTVEATDIETAEFYQKNLDSFKTPETVSASHILLSFTAEDTDEAKAKKKTDLETIHAQILAGGNFEELAAEHSGCPSSQQGGSLGSFQRGQMVPEFDAVAFTMNVGDISEIVETQFGYHIIKVTDKQVAGTQTLAEVKDQLKEYLSAQKKQEALVAYIGELKEKANIVRHSPDFDTAADAAPTE